jgi:hypothetical protein
MEGLFVEEGIRLLFLADTALANMIGDRFYPGELPQNVTSPAIVLSLVSSVPEMSHQGEVGQENARFQLTISSDCVYKTMQVAGHCRRIIREHLRGTLPNGFRYVMARSNDVQSGRTARNLYEQAIDFRITYHIPA